ncbi:MAG: hypothetical protein IKZ65_07880 [Lachnospiraceae bacterium]|nr:hypothetical protein [Lachnospiraceae bacterium]
MEVLSHETAFNVLMLQAVSEGRGDVLFGNDCISRAKEIVPPFLVGPSFPYVYMEMPLLGDPFLDITVLYSHVPEDTFIDSPLASGSLEMMRFLSQCSLNGSAVCGGFEIDLKNNKPTAAAVHFQPRKKTDLVMPFCKTIGEEEKGKLYLESAKRLPEEWKPSFFGIFRGRKKSPLRICGYLGSDEVKACAGDKSRLIGVFDSVGFSAYNDRMLDQICTIMSIFPKEADYQFDILPDGKAGNMFAIDAIFSAAYLKDLKESFEKGKGARFTAQLEEWNIADDRWRKAFDATFAKAIPVELPEGDLGRYCLFLQPQWFKVRWIDGILQPSKLYLTAKTDLKQ